MTDSGKPRNGKLRVPLRFEDALRAALETEAEPQPARPAKKKRPAVETKKSRAI